MALFGSKKNKNKPPVAAPAPVQQGDFFDRQFKAKDENERRMQEQIKMKHPDFVSEFDEVLKEQDDYSAPSAQSAFGSIDDDAVYYNNAGKGVHSTTLQVEGNDSVEVTSVVTSSRKAELSKECFKHVGVCSDIGKRDSQQDAAEVSNPSVSDFSNGKWLGVLCDGMGGMNGGEMASALCVEQMMSAFYDIGETPVPKFYRQTIIDIDDAVASLTDDYGNYLGAGSTLVSVIIDKNDLYWASVGDSHIYIIRQKEMVRVNEEHNYFLELMGMVKRGAITLEQAENDKNREALISYMGVGSVHLMDIIEKPFKLQKDDFVILCSDGLYRSVTDNEIYNIMIDNNSDMQAAADKLVECAMSKNKKYQDNTTVITIRF